MVSLFDLTLSSVRGWYGHGTPSLPMADLCTEHVLTALLSLQCWELKNCGMCTWFPEESGSEQEIIFGYGSLLSKSLSTANSTLLHDPILHTDYLLQLF